MKSFQPTYLYIKQHAITKMLYFGKTTSHDPLKYNGSGAYWLPHLAKHGIEHVETLWFCLFTEEDEFIKFALACSKQWDIVKSENWANLIEENGTDGKPVGTIMSESTKKKISISRTGQLLSEETKLLVSQNTKLALQDPDRRKKISDTHKGVAKSAEHRQKLKSHLAANTNSEEQKARAKIRMTGRLVSDDERTKIAAGVSAFVSQTIWVTDGLTCKRIHKLDHIPENWKRGRKIKP
jgi:hypothetical protein